MTVWNQRRIFLAVQIFPKLSSFRQQFFTVLHIAIVFRAVCCVSDNCQTKSTVILLIKIYWLLYMFDTIAYDSLVINCKLYYRSRCAKRHLKTARERLIEMIGMWITLPASLFEHNNVVRNIWSCDAYVSSCIILSTYLTFSIPLFI